MKFSSVTTEMKAAEQYLPLALFIMLYEEVLTQFESVDELVSVNIQMKATERYFPLVLCILRYKVFLIFEPMGKIL